MIKIDYSKDKAIKISSRQSPADGMLQWFGKAAWWERLPHNAF
jgi:hypothetical protein